MLKCSIDTIQLFLDGELSSDEKIIFRSHLGKCPACRQELSRLKLLWLEIEHEEEIEYPIELPFIRQQVIALTKKARQEAEQTSGFGLWDAQKLAWQPVLAGVSQIPGPPQLGFLTRATIRRLPAVFKSIAYVARIADKGRAQR